MPDSTPHERLLRYLQTTGGGKKAAKARVSTAAADIEAAIADHVATNSIEHRGQRRKKRHAQAQRMQRLARQIDELANVFLEEPSEWGVLRFAPSPRLSSLIAEALDAQRPNEYSRPEIPLSRLQLELKRRAADCTRAAIILSDQNTSSTGGSYLLARCLMVAKEITRSLPPSTTAKPDSAGQEKLHPFHAIVRDLVADAGGETHGLGSGPWLEAIEILRDPTRWDGLFLNERAFHKPNRKMANTDKGDTSDDA